MLARLTLLVGGIVPAASGQQVNAPRLTVTPRVGALVPTTALGPWLSAHARMRPGLSVGVGAARRLGTVLGARAVADVVLGTGPSVHETDCVDACERQSERAGVMLITAADMTFASRSTGMWGFLGAVGGGLKAYVFPRSGNDCRIGEAVCLAMVHFSEDGVDPTIHVAAAATRFGDGVALTFELGDYISAYRGDRLQHDLLFSLGIRRIKR